MQNHHRRSIRLKDYDYTQTGAYFVTICTHDRGYLFGDIQDDAMRLNEYGEIVRQEWEQTAVLRPYVSLDAFVVMPNHIHGIIVIGERRGMMHHAPTSDPTISDAPTIGPPRSDAPTPNPTAPESERQFAQPIARSLSSIVGTYKAAVTRQINQMRNKPSIPVWQRNYYEHIIRHEDDLNHIRTYIETNPARWQADSLYAE